MITSTVIRYVLVLSLITPAFLQERGWRGITPLHSTREEVERLIGQPMMPGGITYDLKTERVNVVYSAGGCGKGHPSEWNVPVGTVIGVTLYPQTRLMLSDLRVDLSRFEKSVNPLSSDSVFYKDDEDGISIGTGSTGEVFVVQYLPSRKDSNLRCPTTRQSSEPARSFDEYSNLKLSDEKARLNNFALRLQSDPQLNGYIVVYGRPGDHSDKAKAHAKRAKAYLVNARRIREARIITIDGGCSENIEVELYTLPSSAPPPTPTARCN